MILTAPGLSMSEEGTELGAPGVLGAAGVDGSAALEVAPLPFFNGFAVGVLGRPRVLVSTLT